MVSLAKLAALNRAMKTPDKMAMELQGLAVTICLGRENRLYSSESRRGGGEAHHLILLDVRIPPLEDCKVKLVDLLRHGAAVVKLHHGRLEESHKQPIQLATARRRHPGEGKYLLTEFHGVILLPERLHQRHLDPGPEASREGPPGAVRLTFPHKP